MRVADATIPSSPHCVSSKPALNLFYKILSEHDKSIHQSMWKDKYNRNRQNVLNFPQKSWERKNFFKHIFTVKLKDHEIHTWETNNPGVQIILWWKQDTYGSLRFLTDTNKTGCSVCLALTQHHPLFLIISWVISLHDILETLLVGLDHSVNAWARLVRFPNFLSVGWGTWLGSVVPLAMFRF